MISFGKSMKELWISINVGVNGVQARYLTRI